MRNLYFCAGLLIMPIQAPIFAGGEVGNGGDVVVCRAYSELAGNHILSVELLDYYEAKTILGFKIDLGDPSLSVEAKVKKVIARLSKMSPTRARLYTKWFEDFEGEAAYVPGVVLKDIPDSQHIATPENCTIEQLVIQKPLEYPFDKRYVFSKDLYDLLDNDGKAGIHLHEIIYREMISQMLAHEDSRAARYLNGLLASTVFDTLPGKDLALVLASVQYNAIDANGGMISRGEQGLPNQHYNWSYDSQGRPITAALADNFLFANGSWVEVMPDVLVSVPLDVETPYDVLDPTVTIRAARLSGPAALHVGCDSYNMIPGTVIESASSAADIYNYDLVFYSSDDRSSGELRIQSARYIGQSQTHTTPEGIINLAAGNGLEFFANGALSNAGISKNAELNVQGTKIVFGNANSAVGASFETSRITFYSNEHIYSGWLAQDADLKTAAGYTLHFIAGEYLTFDPQGLVFSRAAQNPQSSYNFGQGALPKPDLGNVLQCPGPAATTQP